MHEYAMYVGGEWKPSSTGRTFVSINPFTELPWAKIPEASQEDVDDAVRAARAAYEKSWRRLEPGERARLLGALADLLDEHGDRLARIETTDNGKVIRETRRQVAFAARIYRFYASLVDKLYGDVIPFDRPGIFDYTLREPFGVVALITAWNSPIQLLANKLAPALAAGNTAVVKPSEHAPASTLEFAALVEKAGFPRGVVNVITGGPAVGEFLAKHPGINKISFTGGVATGKRVAQAAAENIVPVTLELGGKSANVVFEDADLEKALSGVVAGIFAAAGQTCVAGSRLLVQESIYEEFAQRVAERARAARLGDPLDERTDVGPVGNSAQLDRIMGFVAAGVEEGAHLLVGGTRDVGLRPGLWVAPTVFVDVRPEMAIAREEIFGPVLSVLPFRDEKEAVALANRTVYGLAAGVWTRDLGRAHVLARELEAGVVWVNTYRASAPQAPFGGMKRSGYGRERGLEGLLEFTQVKNVMMELFGEREDPFALAT